MYNRASQALKISGLRLDGIRSNSSLTKESASTLRFNQSLFAESPWLPNVKRYMKQIMRELRDKSLTSFTCSHAHLLPYENDYDMQDSSLVSQKSVRFLTNTWVITITRSERDSETLYLRTGTRGLWMSLKASFSGPSSSCYQLSSQISFSICVT